jgi:methylated-DNA-[protein]-cysteine S-methyltransferase
MTPEFSSAANARHPRVRAGRLAQNDLCTPLGSLSLIFDEEGALHAAGFHLQKRFADAPIPVVIEKSLIAYFAGDASALASVPLRMEGTEFQRAVWTALTHIPLGQTRTYAEIAAQIGRPNAVRAVGLANGSNPISIFVPCHRVIGKDGALTGYAGGVERKRWLLAHEGFKALRD